jgi:hypothetical protein
MVGRRFTAGYFDECMKKLNNLLMYLFHLHALWKSFLIYLQELHDKGVTEVMLFLCIQCHGTTTILELAEEHRQKYFQE